MPAFALIKRSATLHRLLWPLLCLSLLALPGCSGCVRDPVKAEREALKKKLEEEKRKKQKPKPDFEMGRMLTQPNNLETVESAIKPGHWTSATLELKANNYDFPGELATDPFDLEGTPFRLGTSRTAALPKGQQKYLELTFFVPPGRMGSQVTTRLRAEGGREVISSGHPAQRMPAHQFYFFVLSGNPDRYTFIEGLDSVKPPLGSWATDNSDAYYKVMLPHIEHRTPRSNPLTWTGIAYVLWDDIDPGVLTPQQQQALLDWLHWGGQLIVSGPGTLASLRGSFLDPYLPVAGGEAVEFTSPDFDLLNRDWSTTTRPLAVSKPWSGQKLLVEDQRPDAQTLLATPSGEPLLVERRVGRGRVVVSAFRLSQRDLRAWPGFDGFFNACLLRRPPRRFVLSQEGELLLSWAQGYPLRDPTRVSSLHYFTRDAGVLAGMVDRYAQDDFDDPLIDPLLSDAQVLETTIQQMTGGTTASGERAIGAGVAGWDDFNPASEFARQSLRQAAGIVIPKATFVIWVLGAYLLVLVPLNWAVFWLFGRVELAWVAAPLITIVFAIAVIHQAQLDIGFARAKTELAVVELNGDYPRAHVTRYTALYTSLATSYDLRFEDSSALVQPFAPFSRSEAESAAMYRGQSRSTVNYRRGAPGAGAGYGDITLEGFAVPSNSLGMLHSEHMLDLQGGIVLTGSESSGFQLVNDTHMLLQGAGIVGDDRIAWLGDVSPGAATKVRFTSKPADVDQLWSQERDAVQQTSRSSSSVVLNVRSLLSLAQRQLAPGELRLVAWTDEEIPGVTVEPAARQVRQAAVVIAHLRFQDQQPPSPDVNSRPQIEAIDAEPEEAEMPDAEALIDVQS